MNIGWYCGCNSWNHASNLWFVFTSLKWVRDYRKLARCGNLRNYIFSVSLWHTLVVQSDTEVFKLVRMVSTGPSSQHASPKTCDSGCFSFLKRFGSRIGPLGMLCYALSRPVSSQRGTTSSILGLIKTTVVSVSGWYWHPRYHVLPPKVAGNTWRCFSGFPQWSAYLVVRWDTP